MKRIVVDFKKIWFKLFLEATLNFIRNNFNIDGAASQGILWVEHDDNTAYFIENANRDFESELIDERKRLFFPFTLPNFGDPIPCADGEEYAVDDYLFQGDFEEEFEEQPEFDMGADNIIGFLLEIDNNQLIINSAIYHASNALKGDTITIQEYCAGFDYPMTDFIYQFIKK